MLEIRNIHKSFGSTPVLGGIDLDVNQGDVIAIIGPSGSGKTTLLRCLNYLEHADEGTMVFDQETFAMNKISKTEIVDGARDYRLMTRQVVDSILSMCEYNRFTKGIFGWVGYETKWLEYENVERTHGETKWSFWKLFLYSLDGITAFSTVPLAISSIMGVVFCIIAFVAIIALIIKNLIYHDPTPGWPSMVCIILLVSGVQLFCLGIVGQYLSKTYLEVKKRPSYLVKEEL